MRPHKRPRLRLFEDPEDRGGKIVEPEQWAKVGRSLKKHTIKLTLKHGYLTHHNQNSEDKGREENLCADCKRIKNVLAPLRHGHGSSWDDQGTNVTVLVSSGTKCSSCDVMSYILSELGMQKQDVHISFTVFPTKAVQCLRATIDKSTALYLQPTEAKQYLKPFDNKYFSTKFCMESLRLCISGHAHTCSGSQGIPNMEAIVPLYLIDLSENCLVQASTREKYAALSYVWGSSNSGAWYDTWQCSKAVLPKMLEPNFFNWNKVPPTIDQAMKFTREMGLRYLWVDRYCIPQDDHSEKHKQLRSMGCIYYHAHFVIIAADGDGSDGLCKYDRDRRKFRLPCRELLADVGVIYEPVTENTQWATRGWAYQEGLFARRSFVFRKGTVTFQCQKSTWQEGTAIPIPHENNPSGPRTTMLHVHKWPNMLDYRRLVTEYVDRQLTFPCDSLDAFAGILDALEASFPNGFLFGLPEVCFDVGLLWQPKGFLEDRILLAKADSKPIAELPSWSWARWKGSFDFSAWEASAECLFQSYYNQSFYTVTTIVDWQKECQSSGALVSLFNCYGTHRSLAQDNSLTPPTGWMRQASRFGLDKDGTSSRLLQSNNHQFTHQGLGKHVRFRFPLPLPLDLTETTDSQCWTSKIHGRVKRAFLSIKLRATERQEGDCWHVVERTSTTNGELQVGLVRLHGLEPEDWPDAQSPGEFIAVSASEFLCAPGQSVGLPLSWLDEWELKRRSKDDHVYEFYNVMLIERQGVVSVRKGLGRVQKAMWDDLDLEEVDIVLG